MCSLPHARGGVSATGSCMADVSGSSPRPWGCFSLYSEASKISSLFPTPVGVFLNAGKSKNERRTLPHARGGVSADKVRDFVGKHSSPRPWGCFLMKFHLIELLNLFPTPVGVFPQGLSTQAECLSLPHARGGVSKADDALAAAGSSSPRPWGCFRTKSRAGQGCALFPTPVGVFLDEISFD